MEDDVEAAVPLRNQGGEGSHHSVDEIMRSLTPSLRARVMVAAREYVKNIRFKDVGEYIYSIVLYFVFSIMLVVTLRGGRLSVASLFVPLWLIDIFNFLALAPSSLRAGTRPSFDPTAAAAADVFRADPAVCVPRLIHTFCFAIAKGGLAGALDGSHGWTGGAHSWTDGGWLGRADAAPMVVIVAPLLISGVVVSVLWWVAPAEAAVQVLGRAMADDAVGKQRALAVQHFYFWFCQVLLVALKLDGSIRAGWAAVLAPIIVAVIGVVIFGCYLLVKTFPELRRLLAATTSPRERCALLMEATQHVVVYVVPAVCLCQVLLALLRPTGGGGHATAASFAGAAATLAVGLGLLIVAPVAGAALGAPGPADAHGTGAEEGSIITLDSFRDPVKLERISSTYFRRVIDGAAGATTAAASATTAAARAVATAACVGASSTGGGGGGGLSGIAESAGEETDDDDSLSGICFLCHDRPPDAVLLDCGHGGLCHGCGVSIASRPRPSCPICRSPITFVYQLPKDEVGKAAARKADRSGVRRVITVLEGVMVSRTASRAATARRSHPPPALAGGSGGGANIGSGGEGGEGGGGGGASPAAAVPAGSEAVTAGGAAARVRGPAVPAAAAAAPALSRNNDAAALTGGRGAAGPPSYGSATPAAAAMADAAAASAALHDGAPRPPTPPHRRWFGW